MECAQLSIEGVLNWRLPKGPPSGGQGNGNGGFNQTGSEMGNLFYNMLGGQSNGWDLPVTR